MTGAESFRAFIVERGFMPPTMIEPGRWAAFPTNGKGSDTAGRAKLFADGEGGIVHDWRTGESWTWQAERKRALTPSEYQAWREKIEREKREAEAEREREHADAAARAKAIWDKATRADDAPPYLQAKGVKAHGLRLHNGALVVPMRDRDGVLHSLQFIGGEGRKVFLSGGRKRGCYFGIGSRPTAGELLCIAEGYATAASVHEATGHAVVVALDAGNLLPVAQTLHEKYPEAHLILCADDDYRTDGNPGIARATEAAHAVGGLLAVPDFGAERPDGATDFNDLARHRGADAIRCALADARKPESLGHQPAAQNAPAANPASTEDDDEWPEPLPLPEGLPAVAPFDFALLPDSLRPWAEDICERVQCPPDFFGAAIMAALGSVLGRKVGIRPQEKTDWTEYPNQWALVVGRPGVLKSPAIEAALSPIKRLAAKATEAHQTESEQHRITVQAAKLRAEEGEKAARKLLAKLPGSDVSHLLNTEEPEAPALRRYIAVDTNAASLGELHRQNLNGVLVHRDEMGSLLKRLDREDQAEARGFYLTGWNGNSAYTFDRIGRGLNLHIPAVCLSLLGSTQPGRIAEYLRAAVKGGAGDDGLIQRFGLLVWPDTGGAWRDVDRWPDSEARRKANAVFEGLDAEAIGGAKDEFDAVPFLRFDAEGLGLFREWREGWEAKLRGGELHPALESHLAKYRKLVPGLALTLHLAGEATGPVSKRATLQALAWAEYLESHARRAYASVISPEVAAAKAILEKLRRGELAHTFAARDIYRRGWAHLSEREQVLDALQLLADLDRLTIHTRSTEGRTATVYEVNPKGLAL